MKYIIAFTLLVLMTTRSAHAYLDPGTGSMIIQIVMGFVLAGVFTFKTWFYKLKSLFVKEQKTENKDEK